MSRHTTDWEDEGLAAINCDGKDAGIISAYDGANPCKVCGQLIRLKWRNVRIEVVEPTGNSGAGDKDK